MDPWRAGRLGIGSRPVLGSSAGLSVIETQRSGTRHGPATYAVASHSPRQVRVAHRLNVEPVEFGARCGICQRREFRARCRIEFGAERI